MKQNRVTIDFGTGYRVVYIAGPDAVTAVIELLNSRLDHKETREIDGDAQEVFSGFPED
jgi:hypothetical protein